MMNYVELTLFRDNVEGSVVQNAIIRAIVLAVAGAIGAYFISKKAGK